MNKPSYLSRGEIARLFPVLATTSKEGRTTAIILSCLSRIDEFGAEVLSSVGQRTGKRGSIAAYTEVVFKGQKEGLEDRPDGLIVLKNGKKEWRALIETKVGNNRLDAVQIEKYRAIAKEFGVDCVITISNQFATKPINHPLEATRKSRSRIPVYHWSWMYLLTTAELLLRSGQISDLDQTSLLQELLRFLSHESAGVKGFERMPPEWAELNRLVSAGGRIPAKSDEATTALYAWHQETKDLSLIISRHTETAVHEKLSRRHASDPVERHKDELRDLRENNQLKVSLEIPDAAAPLEIVADIKRRTIDVGMTLRAPSDKKTTKARVNWILRQIKVENGDGVFVRLNWPGRSEASQFSLEALRANPSVSVVGKENLQVSSFHIFASKRLGAKFTQQVNFISELELIVPSFYGDIGQNLVEWRRPAPKIRPDSTEVVATLAKLQEDGSFES